jgi:hypothetical protein
MNYYDWYCPKGCCRIVKTDNKFNTIETYKFRKGELIETNRY